MNRANHEYLTIGEIGKLTEINPKSIRYYERIGILQPAWIDPETGYRYYRPEQIHHLFAIKTCIHFGIPLREFPKYMKDGTLYASHYMHDAAENCIRRIQAMLEQLAFFEDLEVYIGQADQLIRERRIQHFHQPDRVFLIREISQASVDHDLFQVFADLNDTAKQLMIQREPFYGRIAIFNQGRLEHLYAAVLVSKDTDRHPTMTLPEASYACLYTETSLLLQAPDIFPLQASSGQTLLSFESTCVSSQYAIEAPGYILRCIDL